MLKLCLGLAAAAIALATTTPARAGEGEEPAEETDVAPPRLPLAHAARPLTLPQGVLEPIARFAVLQEPPRLWNLGFGAAAGLTDHVEVHAVVAPLQISPSATFGQQGHPGPSVGATAWLSGQRSQLGLSAEVTWITVPHGSGAVIDLGLPVHSRSGDTVRLDYGAFVRLTQSADKTAAVSLPFSFAVDLIPAIHLGAGTGLVYDGSLNIPLGFFAGGAIGGADGPLVEIDPYFRLPSLFSSAQSDQRYEAGVTLRGFFYL
ncbi:MAG TPA: hypothetical protein VGI39_09380 [Polyangiaceae bacterium]|jgi:hypothetical protein